MAERDFIEGDFREEIPGEEKTPVEDVFVEVPEETKELRHDGTILNIAKMSVSDIKFKVKYDLVIVQNNNRINICKVEIEMPNEKIATNGFFVQRLDSSNYNFKVKY